MAGPIFEAAGGANGAKKQRQPGGEARGLLETLKEAPERGGSFSFLTVNPGKNSEAQLFAASLGSDEDKGGNVRDSRGLASDRRARAGEEKIRTLRQRPPGGKGLLDPAADGRGHHGRGS